MSGLGNKEIMAKNIQYYMELKCKKLTDIYDKDMISKSLYFIWYITYLDNINNTLVAKYWPLLFSCFFLFHAKFPGNE